MKHKLLVFGSNKTLINEIFVQMDAKFEVMSCSRRLDDLRNHLKYIEPDALVLCLYSEDKENLSPLTRVADILSSRGIPLIVIGEIAKCDEFERIMPRAADFIIRRSGGSSKQIEDQMEKFLEMMDRTRMTAYSEPDPKVEEPEEAPEEVPVRRKHVLVVDDDSGMLKMIKEVISGDYDVATAISGKVALKFLESRKTDMILLDYEMPIQSGAEVYHKILDNPETKDIPVVFLTGVSDRERIADVLAMKPRGYLLKPIDTDRLKKTIAEIVH